MAIEIKELIIRAVLNEGNTTAQRDEPVGEVEKKILKAIKALSKKNKKNER